MYVFRSSTPKVSPVPTESVVGIPDKTTATKSALAEGIEAGAAQMPQCVAEPDAESNLGMDQMDIEHEGQEDRALIINNGIDVLRLSDVSKILEIADNHTDCNSLNVFETMHSIRASEARINNCRQGALQRVAMHLQNKAIDIMTHDILINALSLNRKLQNTPSLFDLKLFIKKFYTTHTPADHPSIVRKINAQPMAKYLDKEAINIIAHECFLLSTVTDLPQDLHGIIAKYEEAIHKKHKLLISALSYVRSGQHGIRRKKDAECATTINILHNKDYGPVVFMITNSKIIHPHKPGNVKVKFNDQSLDFVFDRKAYEQAVNLGQGSKKKAKICYCLVPRQGMLYTFVRLSMKFATITEFREILHEVERANIYNGSGNPNIQPLILGSVYRPNTQDPYYKVDLFSRAATCTLQDFPRRLTINELTWIDQELQNKMLPNIYLELLCQLLNGIEVIHDSNHVHGDIKPGNILFFHHATKNFLLKFTDFGGCVKVNDPFYTLTTFYYLSPWLCKLIKQFPQLAEFYEHFNNISSKQPYGKIFYMIYALAQDMQTKQLLSADTFASGFSTIGNASYASSKGDNKRKLSEYSNECSNDIFALGVTMHEIITGVVAPDNKRDIGVQLAELHKFFDRYPLIEVLMAPTKESAVGVQALLTFAHMQQIVNDYIMAQNMSDDNANALARFINRTILQPLTENSIPNYCLINRLNFYRYLLTFVLECKYQRLLDKVYAEYSLEQVKHVLRLLDGAIEINRHKELIICNKNPLVAWGYQKHTMDHFDEIFTPEPNCESGPELSQEQLEKLIGQRNAAMNSVHNLG